MGLFSYILPLSLYQETPAGPVVPGRPFMAAFHPVDPYASIHQSLALSFAIADPLWVSPRRAYIGELSGFVSMYKHVLGADGGYLSMELGISQVRESLADWYEYGLGRDVTVYDHTAGVTFEGFVNEIEISDGDSSLVRGPLMDITNSVNVTYSTIDNTVSPPILGGQANAGPANDAASQALFGVLARTLSTGGMSASEASQLIDTFLRENKDPKNAQELVSGASSNVSITIRVLGYGYLLDMQYYADAATGNSNASAIVIAVASNNVHLSSDYLNVVANTLQVSSYRAGKDRASAVIKDVVERGDASDNRWVFGVLDGRKTYYSPRATTISYVRRLADPSRNYYTLGEELVYPWNVMPGRWTYVPDFIPGVGLVSALEQDPRAIFGETVTYTAPWKVDMKGGQTATLPQKLAKLGLSGVGG